MSRGFCYTYVFRIPNPWWCQYTHYMVIGVKLIYPWEKQLILW
jgi:hypothetical protein